MIYCWRNVLHHSLQSLDRAVRLNPRRPAAAVWQHQLSDAAQSFCLNRCALWGSGLFAKTGGCIKKSRYWLCTLFSSLQHWWDALLVPLSHSHTHTHTHTHRVSNSEGPWAACPSAVAGRWTTIFPVMLGEGREGGGEAEDTIPLSPHLASRLPARGETSSRGPRRLSRLQLVRQDWD